jgi:hypothetical protein
VIGIVCTKAHSGHRALRPTRSAGTSSIRPQLPQGNSSISESGVGKGESP